jgi:hypothetical protein
VVQAPTEIWSRVYITPTTSQFPIRIRSAFLVSQSAMSSRILTVSTSRPQAHDLISRKFYSCPLDLNSQLITDIGLINDDDSATNIDPDADIVPWTIKNKYYTAEVEFHVKVIASKSEPVDFSGASAIIFVFHKNEVRSTPNSSSAIS